jgi:pectate lyase
MMKQLIVTIVFLMTVIILTGCEGKLPTEEPTITPSIPTEPIDSQPNETPLDLSLFENSFGFSSLIVTNRSNIDQGYYEVENEVEFLNALMDQDTKIIEIKNDLNLGSIEVRNMLEDQQLNLEDYRPVYRAHSRQPLLHPILKETGVGLVRIVLRDNLTIFSKNGSTIRHTSFLIDGSTNIVIRNLEFADLWEWDEFGQGGYNRNDWDYFTVEKSNGIWFDHLTFNQAYDGIIDAKEHSENMTLSWSKLNFMPNDFIKAQIEYLEENIEDNPYYKSLREQGITAEDLVIYSSFQKKGFNLGNTTDGEGFETITMTFHHLEVLNLMDRMPRLRKGDVHIYHIIVDNQDVLNLRSKYSNTSLGFVNQGLVPTEQGAIFMEHSIFKYITTPIKNHQDSNPDSKYTGSYLVRNSELVLSHRTYFGSSTDFNSLWVHTNSEPAIGFQLRNYEEIPYQYTLNDVYFLPETFSIYPTGHQVINDFDWLYIDTNLH